MKTQTRHQIGAGSATNTMNCEAGEATGSRCGEAATSTVEWMPEHLRASHEAAGNRGSYPHNGALRLRCCATCAAEILESDPDWASEVEG